MSKKPIIGIVGKPQCDDIIWNKICISNEIKDAINNNGGVAIGILPQSKIKEIKEGKPFSYQNYYLDKSSLDDLFQTINMCDGVILEGGVVICDYEQEIAKYCTEKDIPLLGICCGCINMALSTGGSVSLDNYDYLKKHHFSLENMDKHKVKIDKDSNLYNLICNDEFTVNSIHKCKIDNAGQYEVKGFSEDGIIELLEMKNKKFNIGVQWHPELITEKKEQNLIFKKFIEHIINSKK